MENIPALTMMLNVFLDKGAVANIEISCDYTLLHVAINFGDIQIVEMFLKNGCDPNHHSHKYGSPYDMAVSRDYDDIAELLLAYGADPAKSNY